MKVLQSLNDCRGTAAVDELHIDALDDIKMLSDPVEAIRYKSTNYIDLNYIYISLSEF